MFEPPPPLEGDPQWEGAAALMAEAGVVLGARLAWNGLAPCYEGTRRSDGQRLVIALLPIDCESRPELVPLVAKAGALLRGVQAPGVVPLLGVGVTLGVPWCALRPAPGRTLAEQLATRGPMALGAALDAAVPLLDTLHAVHARGARHFDLTPTNVLFGGDRPLVVGLGIAQLVLAARDVQGTGPTGKGSGPSAARYLAPEIVAGAWREADGRADVFSVGALLVAMLTGQRPWPEAVRSPAIAACRGLPEVLERAMARDPAGRFASAAAMAEALRALRLGEGVETPALALPGAAGHPAARSAGRPPAPVQGGAGVPGGAGGTGGAGDPRGAADRGVAGHGGGLGGARPAGAPPLDEFAAPGLLAEVPDAVAPPAAHARPSGAATSAGAARPAGRGPRSGAAAARWLLAGVAALALGTVAVSVAWLAGRAGESGVASLPPEPSDRAPTARSPASAGAAVPGGAADGPAPAGPQAPVVPDAPATLAVHEAPASPPPNAGAPAPAPATSSAPASAPTQAAPPDAPPQAGAPARSSNLAPSASLGSGAAPLDGPLPEPLASLLPRIDAGERLERPDILRLYDYVGRHGADARGHLVMARAFSNLRWTGDVIARYATALRVDPDAARRDPRIARDLLDIYLTAPEHADAAARLLAGPLVDQTQVAIQHTRGRTLRSDQVTRLWRLEARMRAQR
jgi:serine/threonine-protein kinase